ncbi:unnamed protein product [Schistocephalus solidus]|uniref:EF-hand domain-containing protein n=1 Tax=Schistocephalus solidus TaxID=70667 RepID=A0A183SLW9_SCHSO|nr:unnamed protein product [Schistocephalus solidus]
MKKPYQIGVDELSRLLSEEERFLFLFRKTSNVHSSFDFMRDHNGVIENTEFEGLVKDIVENVKDNYELKDLEEYKNLLLQQWDENTDGKISKEELKLLLLHDHVAAIKK